MPAAEEQPEKNGQEINEEDHEEETQLESDIIRQVEYYFGDANLPRDKFLREQVKLDDGWIPLEILLKFNRLANLSKDIVVIANALNKSTSGLLEVSEDNKKVRRNPELPVPEMNEEHRKEVMGRTIYAKGFPKDITLDEVIKYFKEHGDVENIVMRRYLDRATKKRLFKGSVFATFKTKENADKFMSSEGLKHGETELVRLWQDDYLKQKHEEYTARKEKKEQKQNNKQNKEEEKDDFKLPTGTILHFTLDNDKITREAIKEQLQSLGGEIAYIDFRSGDKAGHIRYAKENEANEVFPKITDGKLKVEETDITFKLLEGEEESTYLQKTVEEMGKKRRNNKNFRNNKGGNKHFKGKQFRKRKQDDNNDAPSAKVKAS